MGSGHRYGLLAATSRPQRAQRLTSWAGGSSTLSRLPRPKASPRAALEWLPAQPSGAGVARAPAPSLASGGNRLQKIGKAANQGVAGGGCLLWTAPSELTQAGACTGATRQLADTDAENRNRALHSPRSSRQPHGQWAACQVAAAAPEPLRAAGDLRGAPRGQSPDRTGQAWANQRARAGPKGHSSGGASPREEDLTPSSPAAWDFTTGTKDPRSATAVAGVPEYDRADTKSWLLSEGPRGMGRETPQMGCLGALLVTRALALLGVSGLRGLFCLPLRAAPSGFPLKTSV